MASRCHALLSCFCICSATNGQRDVLLKPHEFADAEECRLKCQNRSRGSSNPGLARGLDFWVLTDRSFDLGSLWWRFMLVA